MRKHIFSVVLVLSLMFALTPETAAETPGVSAECAIVMHSGGETVYEKNADERRLIASTTKIMTAILAIESCDLNESVTVNAEWCAVEGSSMYLRAGQELTVRQLLEGLMLNSGNDAALALACVTSGDVESFARLMNEKAAALGMENTHFDNPHGLDSEEHYSTARDMAKLMAYCMDNADFCALATERSCNIGELTFVNHNKLLDRCEGCIGGKTGYTKAAGRCLVSCCERGGTRFICVTLNAPDDWDDHSALYNCAFSEYSDRVLVNLSDLYPVPYANTPGSTITAVPKDELRAFLPKDAQAVLTVELPFIELGPIVSGQHAGEIKAYVDGECIGSTELVYNEARDVLRQILAAEVYLRLFSGRMTEA